MQYNSAFFGVVEHLAGAHVEAGPAKRETGVEVCFLPGHLAFKAQHNTPTWMKIYETIFSGFGWLKKLYPSP